MRAEIEKLQTEQHKLQEKVKEGHKAAADLREMYVAEKSIGTRCRANLASRAADVAKLKSKLADANADETPPPMKRPKGASVAGAGAGAAAGAAARWVARWVARVGRGGSLSLRATMTSSPPDGRGIAGWLPSDGRLIAG